jgi:hypothetical protein
MRRATDADLAAVVALAGEGLGWVSGEPHERLFSWKHVENPFGPSSIWLAEDDDGLVGCRTLLKWRFVDETGRPYAAARAVDTVTLPRAQGQGIFTRLTALALDELAGDGVDFVFNTPNDQSRPGNLKMGWTEVGRMPIGVRFASPAALARMARARVPADKWSLADAPGERAAEVFADHDGSAALLAACAPPSGLSTERTPAFLDWRYRLDELAYRVRLVGRSLAEGCCVYRLRRRGAALEATVADVLVPAGEEGSTSALLRAVRRSTGADYLIATRQGPTAGRGLIPLPRQGPLLVHRKVSSSDEPPALSGWRLSLGDLELF